jgi:hypothetical protein
VAAVTAIALGLLAGGLPAAPALAAPRNQQWYLDQIHVPEAHQITRGDGVTVGMITVGLPPSHSDLADRVLPTMRLASGLRDSVEKAPADYPMADAPAIGEIGLMVAHGGSGLLGVAPGAKVRPIICQGLAEDVNKCMRWLVDSGVKVINFSHAASAKLDSSFDGIRYALSKDVVVVAALEDAVRMPSAQRAGVVLVGGVGRNGKLQSTVQADTRVTVRAPGTRLGTGDEGTVVGLDPESKDGSGYGNLLTLSGDEIAAAITTGVVTLVRAKYPNLNGPSVVNRLLKTATDLGDPGKDSTYGYGVVDAKAAVTADVPAVSANPLGDPGPPDRSWPRTAVVVAASAIGLLAVCAVVAAGAVVMARRRRRQSLAS